MTLPRRRFLNKSLLGLLSVSLLPASSSFLRRNDSSLSINDLFTQLSFKQKKASLTYTNNIFKSSFGESREIKRSELLLYSDNTVCIPEIDHISPSVKENLASIYEKTSDGYKKVISLNQMELIAFENMVTYLKTRHHISDPDELKMLLVPVLKTKKHCSNDNCVDGECSSHNGYFTAQGYCSMQILANGNGLKVRTDLLNFEKVETYQNSFQINEIV